MWLLRNVRCDYQRIAWSLEVIQCDINSSITKIGLYFRTIFSYTLLKNQSGKRSYIFSSQLEITQYIYIFSKKARIYVMFNKFMNLYNVYKSIPLKMYEKSYIISVLENCQSHITYWIFEYFYTILINNGFWYLSVESFQHQPYIVIELFCCEFQE